METVTRYKIARQFYRFKRKHTWRHQGPSGWCFLPGNGAANGTAWAGSSPSPGTLKKTLCGLWMGQSRGRDCALGNTNPSAQGLAGGRAFGAWGAVLARPLPAGSWVHRAEDSAGNAARPNGGLVGTAAGAGRGPVEARPRLGSWSGEGTGAGQPWPRPSSQLVAKHEQQALAQRPPGVLGAEDDVHQRPKRSGRFTIGRCWQLGCASGSLGAGCARWPVSLLGSGHPGKCGAGGPGGEPAGREEPVFRGPQRWRQEGCWVYVVRPRLSGSSPLDSDGPGPAAVLSLPASEVPRPAGPQGQLWREPPVFRRRDLGVGSMGWRDSY